MSDDDILQIEKLVKEKYGTWDWNYGYSPKYDFTKKIKYSGGIIESFLQIKNGIIISARIYGDFFGVSDVGEIEHALVGVKHNPEQLYELLRNFDLNSYFTGITLEELITVMY